MIPNKNLFAGALGKLQNIGGSKVFTIPHTVDVPVQYQVNSNLVGDFVTCSLDGRLWGLKRSNRFTFFALKWNTDSHKLEFAASITRINDTVLARGLDWILTGKVLIKVLDDSPYIATFNLFSDSSLLTLQEGQNIAHCYSILPPLREFETVDDVPVLINEFQIVENLLIRRDSNGYMLSRLIPLEFFQTRILQCSNLFSDDLSLSHSDNHIIAHNSRLWGAGKYALGEVFLLPAVFDAQGKATTFYLYFQHEHKLPRSPQFLRLLINDLDNLTITPFDGHSFALIRKFTSWEDAKNDCIARGGHLATCTSKEKNDFLDSLAEGTEAWLGAVRKAFHDNWVWVNGEEWEYENWCNKIIDDEYSHTRNCGMFLSHIFNEYNGLIFEYVKLQLDDDWTVQYGDKKNVYICEWDSLDVYDTWLNHMNDELDSYSLAPAFLGDILHGYKFNSGHNLCSMSDDNNLLNPVAGEWEPLSEHNGNIHFDVNQSNAISLDNNGANLLLDDNLRIDCNTLNQWLAPAGHVDALDDNFIVSSADNLALVTLPQSAFMREALHNKVLPMSAPLGNGYRFSLGHSNNSSNRKIIDVNQIASNVNPPQPVLWNNVYKHALDLELINVVRDVLIVNEDDYIQYLTEPFFPQKAHLYKLLTSYSNYKQPELGYFGIIRPGNNHYHPVIVLEVSVDIYYVDPVNGNVCFFDTLHATFDDYEFCSYGNNKRAPIKVTHPVDYVTIINGKIGFPCTTYYLNENAIRYGDKPVVLRKEEFFLPLKNVPDNLKDWCIPNRLPEYTIAATPYANQHYASGKQGIVLDNITNSYAHFHEVFTNLPFAVYCPNVPDITRRELVSIACEVPYTNIDKYTKRFTHSIHIAGVKKGRNDIWMDYNGHILSGDDIYNTEINKTVTSSAIYDLYIFRSQLHSDVLNFDSELQRSCLS